MPNYSGASRTVLERVVVILRISGLLILRLDPSSDLGSQLVLYIMLNIAMENYIEGTLLTSRASFSELRRS